MQFVGIICWYHSLQSILIINEHVQYYLDLLHVATYSDKMTQTEAPKKLTGMYICIH